MARKRRTIIRYRRPKKKRRRRGSRYTKKESFAPVVAAAAYGYLSENTAAMESLPAFMGTGNKRTLMLGGIAYLLRKKHKYLPQIATGLLSVGAYQLATAGFVLSGDHEAMLGSDVHWEAAVDAGETVSGVVE